MQIKPSQIRLDASTVCQLKCPTCKTTSGLTARTLGSKTLKFADFENFVAANPWIRHIELSSQGEIFLNRDLLKIVEHAYAKKITLSAATGVNLNTVSEEMLEGLVKYQFSVITCSIDGASRETYRIYRRGGDFEKVMENIRKINELKIQYRSVWPRLRWQFIAFGHNEHEILLARKMALKFGMEFYVKLAWDDFSPVKNKYLVKRISGLRAASREEYRKAYGRIYLGEKDCSQMWLQPQINPDGRVLGCCQNHWGDYGNAFEEDLVGILNNEKMNYARAMLLGKEKERDDIPCTRCPLYKEMKRSQRWLFSRGKDPCDPAQNRPLLNDKMTIENNRSLPIFIAGDTL
ncbi:MAG: radical SAM protein [Candidatus Omnitrophota bacterium]|nr:radical SAM protein [Candidatus Omnitrophota bacterium]MDZ4243124.1 radical SAM protein [Candidatus Omnitrophota bacterium]